MPSHLPSRPGKARAVPALLPLLALLAAGCSQGPLPRQASRSPEVLPLAVTPLPTGAVPWDWQIGAGSDANVIPPAVVRLMDVDGFDISATRVAQLKAQNISTVCYISVGTWENWRPDAGDYPDALKLQKVSGWAGEWYVDIRDVFRPNSTLAAILTRRFQMCRDKGFDALEPDNLDVDQNTSRGLTVQDSLNFATWVADAAHAVGLAVPQKNMPDRILLRDGQGRALVDVFDGVLNEQCQQYSECGPLVEYTRRGKLALEVEYRKLNCAAFVGTGVNAMKRDLGLVGPHMKGYQRTSCV